MKITPTYTYITELWQQVLKYNQEARCTSQISCAQVLELPQGHVGDKLAMIPYALYRSGFCAYIYIYTYIYIYIYTYIYIYIKQSIKVYP